MFDWDLPCDGVARYMTTVAQNELQIETCSRSLTDMVGLEADVVYAGQNSPCCKTFICW